MTRKRHSQLPEEKRKKANARSYLNVYVRLGKVRKMPCEVCSNPKSEAHHDDYNKPLEVKWLCRPHHLEYHRNNPNIT
jgi:hypothetical protein